MFLNNTFKKIAIVLCSIFLSIIILFAPLRYYLYKSSFYNTLYKKNGVYEILDKNDVKILTESVFNYFKYGKPFEYFNLKNGFEYFTNNEISHLNDVRILLFRITLTFNISIALFIIFIFLLIEKKYLNFLKNISIIFTASSSFILSFILVLYLFGKNFWILFEKFHLLFFPQGNWAFPEGSLLITIFPFGFFYDFFVKLILTSFIISIVLLLIGAISLIYLNLKLKRKNYE